MFKRFRYMGKRKSKLPMVNLYSERILFIHIPKNAGTSICHSFNIENPTHITSKEIIKCYGSNHFNKHFTFAIIRNPLDRFLSLYNYSRMDRSYYHNNLIPEKSKFGKHLDYEILKNSTISEAINLLLEGKLMHDHAWNHWMPQHKWVCNDKGEILVDRVYRLGELEYLIKDLKNIGINFNSFPKLNTSQTSKFKIHLSALDEEKLIDFYYQDFQIFNF